MANLIIVRGLPGSGKSTYAKSLGIYHVEADFYHMIDGYRFVPEKLKNAHRWCYDRVVSALDLEIDVVVSNTFTTLDEMQPYLDLTSLGTVKVKVYRMKGSFKDVHGVPEDVLKKMKARFEDYPGETFLDPYPDLNAIMKTQQPKHLSLYEVHDPLCYVLAENIASASEIFEKRVGYPAERIALLSNDKSLYL